AGDFAPLDFAAPLSPAPKTPGRYMLVFQGALGAESDAVVGKATSIPLSLTVRLLKRKDQKPLVLRIETVSSVTGQTFSVAVTNSKGEARVAWEPGATYLRIATGQQVVPVNRLIFWAGPEKFASNSAGAKVITGADLANERLTVLVPITRARETDRIDPCTGFDVATERTEGSVTVLQTGEVERRITSIVWSFLAFTRGDTGVRTVVLDGTIQFRAFVLNDFVVAEDLSRVGSVIGTVERRFLGGHAREIIVPEFRSICRNLYDETETRPVLLVEQ
ncbi:MAG: hypothetical protein HY728_08105, partial [Candidatus Rokubacteria bacterium]|nr:hypothetical protein [Candidatus Rokubacteria bacterium]